MSACGVCIDDKIASCYDHAVVTQAKAKGHAVGFFEIKGDLVRNAQNRREIARMIAALPGVQPGSGRVSLENAAFSFAFDPRKTSVEASQREIGRKLASKGLSVTLLRTL
ncbi:MAG: hypothetical protein ACREQZ_12970 [Woeseiaceae bacterium]